jgi:hypothetical protein
MNLRNMRAGERRKFAKSMQENGATIMIGVTGLSFARAILPVLLLLGVVGVGFAQSHGHAGTNGLLALGGLSLGTVAVENSATSVKALKQKKVNLKTEADGIIAGAVDKGFSAEDRTKLDGLKEQIVAIDGDIERIEAFREVERSYGSAARADAPEAAKKAIRIDR